MLRVEIRFQGQLSRQWSDWFGGLTVRRPEPGETVLTGLVEDPAALYGIISRLRHLGLSLISVSSEQLEGDFHERS